MNVLFCKVGGLGDSLSALPALAALRRGLPEARITVLCSPTGRALFAAVPHLRPVSVARAALAGLGGLRRLPGLARCIGRQDVALLSHDECSSVHLLARLVARRCIGFAAGVARGERVLDERLAFRTDVSPYEQTLDLVRHLCGRPLVLERELPAVAGAEDWLRDRGVSGRYGVVHPGAATALQLWGRDRFEEAARRLSVASGFPWLLVEKGEGLSLRRFAGVLAGASGFLGNHSGPLHLAAAVGTPWVAVSGPSARAWDPPWTAVPGRVLRSDLPCVPCGALGCPATTCRRGTPGACMVALSPEDVARAVLQVVETAGRA